MFRVQGSRFGNETYHMGLGFGRRVYHLMEIVKSLDGAPTVQDSGILAFGFGVLVFEFTI
jgi:hypothetical protein